MSFLHIIGFGAQPKFQMKVRWKWYPRYPEDPLEIEPSDAIILNLIDLHDATTIKEVTNLVEFIGQNGGLLLVVAAPFMHFSRHVSNYQFLPWSDNITKRITTRDCTDIRAATMAPSWVQWFIDCSHKNMIAPVFFPVLPSLAHVLMQCGREVVCISYKHMKGRLLILPSIRSIIHGEMDSSAKKSLAMFLECLGSQILFRFEEISKPPPEWLDSIQVGNEGELRTQYENLGGELDRLHEEKIILADDGHALTRKVASHLEWLGFQTEEKENTGYQDIEISEGEFRAVVECSGAMGQIKIDKIRQLLEYISIEVDSKGFLIGNPWRDKHPRNRDLSKAFSDRVLKSAEKLGICLVTVPHLYRVCLDIQSDEEKAKVRESLKNCTGLWQYPANDWN